MERRFSCTACGKCCYGLLPLTIDDALAHADKFPLLMVWTPVRQGGRSYQVIADLGITFQITKRLRVAVRITPTAYIQPGMPCPELTEDGLCGIHEVKPQRCRTMPFSGLRDETDQDDLMLPRAGWACDTSDQAPVVYRDRIIIDRDGFSAERQQLIDDAAILKPYAQWLLDSQPSLGMDLQKIARNPGGGQVLVAFSTLIPRLPKVDIYGFAEKQFPVMKDFAERTADDSDLASFHQRYVEGAAAWEKVARGRP